MKNVEPHSVATAFASSVGLQGSSSNVGRDAAQYDTHDALQTRHGTIQTLHDTTRLNNDMGRHGTTQKKMGKHGTNTARCNIITTWHATTTPRHGGWGGQVVASLAFPVPGGPYSSTPLQGRRMPGCREGPSLNVDTTYTGEGGSPTQCHGTANAPQPQLCPARCSGDSVIVIQCSQSLGMKEGPGRLTDTAGGGGAARLGTGWASRAAAPPPPAAGSSPPPTRRSCPTSPAGWKGKVVARGGSNCQPT